MVKLLSLKVTISALQVNFFFVLVKSDPILPVCLQRVMEKALFLHFLKVSTDHLFDTLESGKRNCCFGKSLGFWIQTSV